jgi:polysaccharide biosynthesis transport protein
MTDINGEPMRVGEELINIPQVLWRYKWMIAACAIITLMVALGVSFLLTPLYTGTATVRAASVPSGDYAPINSALLTRLTNTLVETATSDASLDEVANNLGLEEHPNVEVEVIPETELIRISSSNPDPARARDIANTLASMMVDQSVQWYGSSTLTGRREKLFTIVEPASLAQRPTTPKVPLNAALGLLAGLATGVILAFFFEGMDDTLRGIEDIQVMTPLPILGQIPKRKRTFGLIVGPIFSRQARLLPMTAFNQLGTRLLLSADWPKSTSFLLTSPEPGAGKSTVAANLSVSLAKTGYRVVLIDMDFHRPRQHSIFNLPNEEGVSDYLCGQAQLEVLQNALHPNLQVMTAGLSLDGTSEWLTPNKIRELLKRLGSIADYVLIDAPAFLSLADPVVIASQADAVILVVARRKTGRMQMRLVLQQLSELKARVAGIVVNKMPNSRLYTYYPERRSKIRKPRKKNKIHSIKLKEARPSQELVSESKARNIDPL